MNESNVRHIFPNFVSGGTTVCPKGHTIPEKAVSCLECAIEQNEKAVAEQQVEYLRKARDREWNYTLRVAKGTERHAMLYSTHSRTFCGRLLKGRPQVQHEPYSDQVLATLCPACRAAIARALQIMDRPQEVP
jgi:hypothetical protein